MATTTTDLGKIMLTNGGEYDPETTYDAKTFVLYNGSTYIALKTNVGIEPVDDRVNWQLMARGFMGEEVDIQGYVYVESEEDEDEEIVPEPMLDADALGGNPPEYYAPQNQISDEFSEETDYLKGDYCIWENKLYKFTEDKEAGAWDEAKVVPVSVGDEITQLNSTTTKEVVLWSNYELNEIAPGLIPLDLTGAKYIIVLFSSINTMEGAKNSVITKNIPNYSGSCVSIDYSDKVWGHIRTFKIQSNGIYFNEGNQFSLTPPNTITVYPGWNNRAIPYEIIGIY